MATKNEKVLKALDETYWYFEEVSPILKERAKAQKLDLFLLEEYVKGLVLLTHPVIKTFMIIEHYSIPEKSTDFFVFEKTGNKLYGFFIRENLVRYGNFKEGDIKQFLFQESPFVHKTIGDLLKFYDIPGASDITAVHFHI